MWHVIQWLASSGVQKQPWRNSWQFIEEVMASFKIFKQNWILLEDLKEGFKTIKQIMWFMILIMYA